MRSILVRSTRALTSDRHQHHPLAVTSAVIRLHATAIIIDTALKQLEFRIRYSGFDINLHLGLGIMAQLPVPARSEQLQVTHSPSSAPDWKDWLAALRHTLGIAARYRDKTPKNPARAIHICRARLKEARSLLRLAPPSLREAAKACRNELAAAARIISAPRDAFVVAETLKDLIKDELPHLSVRTLPTGLLRGTGGRTRDQHRALLQQTSREVEKVRVRIATWSVPTDPIKTLINRAGKSWRRARKLIPDPPETATEEQMHEFRKAIIICRYQAAYFHKQYRDEDSNVEVALEILRKKLGKINDLYRLDAELIRLSTKFDSETLKYLQSCIQKNLKKIKIGVKNSIRDIYY